MTQESFAKAVKRSYSAVRSYEGGRKPPLQVMATCMALCMERGLVELGLEVESAALAADVTQNSAGQPGPVDLTRMHRILDRIMTSGDLETIRMVERMMETSLYFITSGKSGELLKGR